VSQSQQSSSQQPQQQAQQLEKGQETSNFPSSLGSSGSDKY